MRRRCSAYQSILMEMIQMKKMTAIKIYDHLEEIILVILFVILVAVIFLQVVTRYVFNNSLSWTEALGRYIFVWLSWLGVSLAAKKGEHIKITAFIDKFSFKKAQFLNILSEILVIAICGVTIYYGVVLCDMLIGMNSQDAALHINPVFGYAAVPVGCGLQVLRSIQSMLKSCQGIRFGTQALDNGEGGME